MCMIGTYSVMHRKNKPETSGKFLWKCVNKEEDGGSGRGPLRPPPIQFVG